MNSTFYSLPSVKVVESWKNTPKNIYFSIKDKMMCLGQSPFHFNLFTDSDTYFVEDPSVLFSIFDRFEFACSHAPMRVKYDRENVPEWFKKWEKQKGACSERNISRNT